ncbi:MAG TPA: EAL domain-containing protein [Mycobacteriales bacterium]|nr:EAL domain-containing protein [Mycobacteriales bacterium]
MSDLLERVHFAFQPVFNLRTGGVVAVEVLARLRDGTVRELLDTARREHRLLETDLALAVGAVAAAADQESLLPLHVNLLAETVASSWAELAPLRDELRRTGRRTRDVVVDVSAPYSLAARSALLGGLQALREDGFGIALDGLGDGDSPLTVLAEASPDLLKLDRRITAGLPHDQGQVALVEALVHLAGRIDAGVVAEGVETNAELAALRRLSIGFAQGNLLAPSARRPAVSATLPPAVLLGAPERGFAANAPALGAFLHPAITLPVAATAEDVRVALTDQPAATGVVLVDPADQPVFSVDRNRFLLAVTGPYGHALHARREATRLADRPHIIGSDASLLTALDVVAGADRHRAGDDLVVVDEAGRCRGIVRVTELVRGIAEQGAGQPAGRHSR